MRLTVLYFAALRAAAGQDREVLDSPVTDPAGLYAQLKERFGWRFEQAAVRVAINGAMASWNHPLQAGDEIAFLPPFSGG
jgi:sulfur-carrier protein